MILIRKNIIEIPSTKDELRTEITHEDFNKEVQQFAVIMTGYEMKYDTNDHNFRYAIVELNADYPVPNQKDDTIVIKGTLGLRRTANNYDRTYSGYIKYALIVEV